MNRKHAVAAAGRPHWDEGRYEDRSEGSPPRRAIQMEDQESASRMQRLDAVPLKFIRFTAVRERTGLSRSTIWRLERQGAFPKHRRISASAVGWLEHEVNDWVRWRAHAG